MIEFVAVATLLSLFTDGGVPYLLLTLAFFLIGIIIGVLLSFFKLFKRVSSLYPTTKENKKPKHTQTKAETDKSEEAIQPNKQPPHSGSGHELQWNGEHFEQKTGSPSQNNPLIPLQEQSNLIENRNYQKGPEMTPGYPNNPQNNTLTNNIQHNNPSQQATENKEGEPPKPNNLYYNRKNWYYYRY